MYIMNSLVGIVLISYIFRMRSVNFVHDSYMPFILWVLEILARAGMTADRMRMVGRMKPSGANGAKVGDRIPGLGIPCTRCDCSA